MSFRFFMGTEYRRRKEEGRRKKLFALFLLHPSHFILQPTG